MLTAANIATIQSALDTLAAIPSARLATTSAATVPLLDLHIKCYYCAPREYTEIGARKITRKVSSSQYEAVCDIYSLDVSATGATRAAALRNLFKAIRNAASLNAPTLRVPLVLCEPTKAQAQARAERKAQRDAAWQADLDRAATAVEAEREAATTIIDAAPSPEKLTALLPCATNASGRYHDASAPRYIESVIMPPDAAPGSEGIFKALFGLRTEQKIVALVNALHAAGVTLHRVDEDGDPIVRAAMPHFHPDIATATVLNLYL